LHRSAVVESSHGVTVADLPGIRIVTMNVEERRPLLDIQRAIDVGVARVQEMVAALRREQDEREAEGMRRVSS
jgi:hypothetical protein